MDVVLAQETPPGCKQLSRMLKRSASSVLASLEPSTGAHRHGAPYPSHHAAQRLRVGPSLTRPCWTIFLSKLRVRVLLTTKTWGPLNFLQADLVCPQPVSRRN